MALRIEAPRSTTRNPGATRPDGSSGEKALREPHDAPGPRRSPSAHSRPGAPRDSTGPEERKKLHCADLIRATTRSPEWDWWLGSRHASRCARAPAAGSRFRAGTRRYSSTGPGSNGSGDLAPVSVAFDDRALAALRPHPGAWHCMPCWARAADLTTPEDVTWLRALARRLRRFSRTHEVINAGPCARCGGVMKDDLLVRDAEIRVS